MKKIAVIILALFFLQFISAVEIEMKDSFSQGETLLAKFSGNFLTPVTQENVFFYRGHVRIPIESEIAKINDEYYLYALLTHKEEGNYSLSIEDTRYMKGSEISEEKITKNFTIANSTASFYVTPGFIIATANFSLKIQNLQETKNTIYIETTSNQYGREIYLLPDKTNQKEFTLKSGEIKDIDFGFSAGNPSLQIIKLHTKADTTTQTEKTTCFFWENCTATKTTTSEFAYEIPVYIATSASEEIKKPFRFEPAEIETTILTNELIKRQIYLYNTGNSEIKNINLSISDSLNSSVNISQKQISVLAPNSNVPIEISFLSSEETEINGNIKAVAENFSASSFILVSFRNNYTSSEEESPYAKTCAELNGTICDTKIEKCDKETVSAKDNLCCRGICQKIESKNNGKIIAVVLIALVIAGLTWFYFAKYKKAKRPLDLIKISKGKKV